MTYTAPLADLLAEHARLAVRKWRYEQCVADAARQMRLIEAQIAGLIPAPTEVSLDYVAETVSAAALPTDKG